MRGWITVPDHLCRKDAMILRTVSAAPNRDATTMLSSSRGCRTAYGLSTRRDSHPSCVQSLLDHQRQQADERAEAREYWHDSGLVFVTSIGTPIGPRNFTRMLHEIVLRLALTALDDSNDHSLSRSFSWVNASLCASRTTCP